MFPVRAAVQDENQRQFDALTTPVHIYTAIDSQSSEPGTPDLKYVLDDLQASKGLRLRVGAQVMLLANLNVTEGLVNGSRGVVVDFVSMEEASNYLHLQSRLRGGGHQGEEDKAMAEFNAFVIGNKQFYSEEKPIMFPRVLFETKNATKEVLTSPRFLDKS